MKTAKERIVKMIENIPENASREEVLYRLRLFHSVELGLRDAEDGKLIDHDELFDELLGDVVLDSKSKQRPSRKKENHRPRQAKSGPQVHRKFKKAISSHGDGHAITCS